MRDDSLSKGAEFSRWQHLTVEYAESLQVLQGGDCHALANADRIARAFADYRPLQASPSLTAV